MPRTIPLVFESNREGNSEIYMMHADGAYLNGAPSLLGF